MADDSVVLMGVGDVGPIHEPMGAYSALAKPTLAAADIRFAQVERVYSERGALQVHSGGAHSRVKPHMASVFTDCGFDVVSVASNHAMDWGEDALLDTIALFRERGIAGRRRGPQPARSAPAGDRRDATACGSRSSPTARSCRPATRRGTTRPASRRCARTPTTSRSTTRRACRRGSSPFPTRKISPAWWRTSPRRRRSAHAVVLSLHWGIHFIPRVIADYQPAVASAAFAAGADLILGHHAHTPKAIGVHDGKVCFYSLSNFIMSSTAKTPAKAAEFAKQLRRRDGSRLSASRRTAPTPSAA